MRMVKLSTSSDKDLITFKASETKVSEAFLFIKTHEEKNLQS
jgi:hypothetical protein